MGDDYQGTLIIDLAVQEIEVTRKKNQSLIYMELCKLKYL